MSGDGLCAIVTGSASGLGAATAAILAKGGARIVVNYSSSKKEAEATADLCRSTGGEVVVVQGDVSRDEDCRKIAAAAAPWGRLDALINNAGTTSSVHPKDFEAQSVEEWDHVFSVNVRGIFSVTRAALPLLKAAPEPAIVNTASIVGLRPGPQPLAYAASKAAVVSLTKTLALNLGPKIRVNAVAPCWMEGDWMKRMLKDHYDDLMARRAKATPLKRCVTADDVAETMLNLIQSNRFVTGEIIVIDGGFASST